MMEGGKPLPDVIPSFKTPAKERSVADHPSLKPQHLLRILVRALLPMNRGVLLDPFMGSGSTVAAGMALGFQSIGIEIDADYFKLAKRAIPQLAGLYPMMNGSNLIFSDDYERADEYREQLLLLESTGSYRRRKRSVFKTV